MMTLLFSKQCILPSFGSKGRKLSFPLGGQDADPNSTNHERWKRSDVGGLERGDAGDRTRHRGKTTA